MGEAILMVDDPVERSRQFDEDERRRAIERGRQQRFRDEGAEQREQERIEGLLADQIAGVDRRVGRLDDRLAETARNASIDRAHLSEQIGEIIPKVRDIVNGKLGETRAAIDREFRDRDERLTRELSERDQRHEDEAESRGKLEERLRVVEGEQQAQRRPMWWLERIVIGGLAAILVLGATGAVLMTLGYVREYFNARHVSTAPVNPLPLPKAPPADPLAPRPGEAEDAFAGRCVSLVAESASTSEQLRLDAACRRFYRTYNSAPHQERGRP